MVPVIIVVAVAILVSVGTQAGAAESPLASLDTAAMPKRSLLGAGNQARLQRVMAKARRGVPITVGVIGGSITQGAEVEEQR